MREPNFKRALPICILWLQPCSCWRCQWRLTSGRNLSYRRLSPSEPSKQTIAIAQFTFFFVSQRISTGVTRDARREAQKSLAQKFARILALSLSLSLSHVNQKLIEARKFELEFKSVKYENQNQNSCFDWCQPTAAARASAALLGARAWPVNSPS